MKLFIRLLAPIVSLALAACGGADDPEAGGEPRSAAQALTPAQAALAHWSTPKELPLVPAAASLLPNGKVLFWSAEDRFTFYTAGGRTYTSLYDPIGNTATERLVTETGHNMFCPGTTNLPDGRILVNGGIDSPMTSLYDPQTDSWSTDARMNIPRGYQGNTLLADGSVLTLGGSWSGDVGGKHGEVWTPDGGWRTLGGLRMDAMQSGDPSRAFGIDSHLWLIPADNGRVFYAGPSPNMHWLDTRGSGKVEFAARRGDDEFSINGTAVMYDAGKILKAGGAPGYEGMQANANSYVIDLEEGVAVRRIASMAYRRAFHNGVVLPNGQVVVVGGQTYELAFTDSNSVLAPELFDPVSETWTTLPAMSVPRNYHSVALLLPDARVLSAGGGLCGVGCDANHDDLQVLSPPYLFNADGSLRTRPKIISAPASTGYGTTVRVTTDRGVSAFSLVRVGSTTHTVNNDQRRLAIAFSAAGSNAWDLQIPSNPGLLLPGYWMLFALDSQGTPSVAAMLRVDAGAAPVLQSVPDRRDAVGTQVQFDVQATGPNGAPVTYSAEGLPAGTAINAASGRISGAPGAQGRHKVTLSASAGGQTVSTTFMWTIGEPGTTRYVKLEAVTAEDGQPLAAIAELNLLDGAGRTLARDGWTVAASSADASTPAQRTIDGDAATSWVSMPSGLPQSIVVDLGGPHDIGGLRYLPRSSTPDGRIARFRFYISADGADWGPAVAEGSFADFESGAEEKTIYLNNLARGRSAGQSSILEGGTAERAVDGVLDGTLYAGSVAQTDSGPNEWWEVDLGAAHRIHAVRLWNRTDCCGARLNGVVVLLSDAPMAGRSLAELRADPKVFESTLAGPAVRANTMPLAGRGRYLRVQHSGEEHLQLAEVEVYGSATHNVAPTLAAGSAASSTVGDNVSRAASASDPDGDTLTFSATGLPPGLAVNAATGLISGRPTTAGTYAVQVTVSDGQGGSATAGFDWTVLAATPTVSSLTPNVATSGATLRYAPKIGGGGTYQYQWNFGDGTAPTGYAGSPDAEHRFAAAGVYTVTLTMRAPDGTSTTHSFLQAVGPSGSRHASAASSKLALDPRDGGAAWLWAVNPDNDSVSVFDVAGKRRLAEVTVGKQPSTLAFAPGGKLWVVNTGSATISVIDSATRRVVQTLALPRASQPYGLVFDAADGAAYVALQASGKVLRLSSSGSVADSESVGAHPRHLAIGGSTKRLYVSRYISPPLPGEGTSKVSSVDASGNARGGELVVLTPGTLTTQRTLVLRYSTRTDTTLSGRGVPNYLGAAAIAPDGLSAWVPGKQDNVARGLMRDGRNLNFQNTVRAITSRLDLKSQTEDVSARIDHDNAGVASAAAYHPSGVYLFVALESSRQVAVVDAAREREMFRLEVGRAPQGLLVSPDGKRLFVHNFMDRTVTHFDLTPLVVQGQPTATRVVTLAGVASDKLAATVLKGKQLFYDARDPRLARDAYMSCAACHNDGGHDGRTWDLSGFGEGLRNTTALRGRASAQGFLHWSANFDEGQDFEAQIRNLAGGSGLMSDADFNAGTRAQALGTKKAGKSADLDALAAYMASLSKFDATPYRSSDGKLTSAALAGRNLYVQLNCASCHTGSRYTNSSDAGGVRNVGTLKSTSGKRLYGTLSGIDVPTLRDVWNTAPYLHDGSAATLTDAIRAHKTLAIGSADAASVAAYLREIGSEESSAPAPSPATGTGLAGNYFPNITLSGSPKLKRLEAVDFSWDASPGNGVPGDNFSVRWTGTLEAPATGTYYLRTRSNAGVRVWFDDRAVISNWTSHTSEYDTTAALQLQAGRRYRIRIEYYETVGWAVMSLQWRTPGTSSYSAIPKNRLYP